MSGRRVSPLPKDWHIIRKVVLERDEFWCTWVEGKSNGIAETIGELFGPDRCASKATDVDHINDRDDHSTPNLRALCGPHHLHRTGVQARASYLGRLKRPPEQHPGLKE